MRFTFQYNIGILYSRVRGIREGARAGLRRGVDRAAAVVEAEAKRLVPVDTGRLRDAIHTEITVDRPTRQERVITPVVEAPNDWGIDPPYARRIEYGFVGVDRLGRYYNQPAQPYMRPAADGKRDEAARIVQDEVAAGAAEGAKL